MVEDLEFSNITLTKPGSRTKGVAAMAGKP